MSDLFSFSTSFLRPGILHGSYPEREALESGGFEQSVGKFLKKISHSQLGWMRRVDTFIAKIHTHGKVLETYDQKMLDDDIFILRQQLRQQDVPSSVIARAFALVREVSGRVLGYRHYDVQLMGGWVMLQGGIAEMETGEGKTLTATLAAATAALAGTPVHVITVNDYLVQRDAELMAPLYKALGLSVGVVTQEMDDGARRLAYASDLTYCSNKQVAFDYLRDRLVMGEHASNTSLELGQLQHDDSRLQRLYLRGLCFAVVDEADSVFVDEARTPLIISKPSDCKDENRLYEEAMGLAVMVKEAGFFAVDYSNRQIHISEEGSTLLLEAISDMGPIWQAERRREDLVRMALSAKYLYRLDYEYLVRDGKIVIIDSNTGRTMADRTWENGLQQMIEIKEGCEFTEKKEPLARITYQRFFRRYLCLAGMTGTAKEIRGELFATYGLHVHRVPTHRPCLREKRGYNIYPDKERKWAAVIAGINRIHSEGRPVLVGTRSVAESELLGKLLDRKGLGYRILNARQDKDEADIVARAGNKGQITIATNMAGRGTDIPLGGGVAGKGGLHVMICEHNDARRIDRQLLGRCARQGDPGSYEYILSMEDDNVSPLSVKLPFRQGFYKLLQKGNPLIVKIAMLMQGMMQRSLEKRHRGVRDTLMRHDEQLARTLSFAGPME